MAELIMMPFGMLTLVGQRNHVLDGNPGPSCKGSIVRGKVANRFLRSNRISNRIPNRKFDSKLNRISKLRRSLGEGAAYCKVHGISAMSCAEPAKPIEMPFEMWAWVGQGTMY